MIERRIQEKRLTLPNAITMIRIIGTFFLLFLEVFSEAFYVIYTICGISDVLDGFTARMMKSSTDFGARLDSAADLFFYAVMICKLRSFLWQELPRKIWFVVGLIILLRIVSYTMAAWKYHRFASQHTYLNKLTGAVVFLLPYMAIGKFLVVFSFLICIVAMIATVEELCIHLRSKEYHPNRKSIWTVYEK